MEATPREIKRELIINAAIQVITEKGYHNTTMGEIAAVAGIGKATIYEYFNSKLELFQAMMVSTMNAYNTTISWDRSFDRPVAERLKTLIESHIKFCRENRKLTRILFWDTEIIDTELKDWMLQLRKEKEDILQEVVIESIARGEIRDLDPSLVTTFVSAIISYLWAPLVLFNWDMEASKLADGLVDIMLNGIKSA